MPRVLLLGLALLLTGGVHADSLDEALNASREALAAARSSQGKIDRLDDATRALQEQERAVQFQVQQQAAYAADLEQKALEEEQRQAALEQELAGIAATQTELLPLIQRMHAELALWQQSDLPFQQTLRARRLHDLQVLIADPERPITEKYRRVLEAYRTEVDYGYSLGFETAEIEVEGATLSVSLVRVGRVGLYGLAADGDRACFWDAVARRWRWLEDDYVDGVAQALAVARGEVPPALLELPLRGRR